MSEKKQLPKSRLKKLLRAFDDYDVDTDYRSVFEEKTSFIRVEDCGGDAVSVSYDFYGDDATHAGPSPTITHTVTAAGLTFEGTQYYSGVDDWELISDKYFIADDDMRQIASELSQSVRMVDIGCIDYPTSLCEEWSRKEVIDEILSQLNYSEYVEIDDEIYPVEDTLEEFLDEYNSSDPDGEPLGEDDCTLLSAREAAAHLADQIY